MSSAHEHGSGQRPQVERRERAPSSHTPESALAHMPALVVLERLPVPVLAINDAGAIVFSNTAFAQMLGYTKTRIKSMNFADIMDEPFGEATLGTVRGCAGRVVELLCQDGFTIKAKMSKSVFSRSDDQLALVAFEDVTDHSWTYGSNVTPTTTPR